MTPFGRRMESAMFKASSTSRVARVTTTVVRGLVDRDIAGGLTLTKKGRAVLASLLMQDE
jgi:hypothetical protein